MPRTDYAFPFRIDPVSGQAAQAPYAAHVDQMIRQILLTTPGERVDLPQVGCGIRQLLFAPSSTALQSTTQLLIPSSEIALHRCERPRWSSHRHSSRVRPSLSRVAPGLNTV